MADEKTSMRVTAEGMNRALRDNLETLASPIDYRQLLVKYIAHVEDCEGVNFIPPAFDDAFSTPHFTETERATLRQLAADAVHVKFPD